MQPTVIIWGIFGSVGNKMADISPLFNLLTHQGPKQNCTVKDEILRAEICTPSFETVCEEESMTIKVILS